MPQRQIIPMEQPSSVEEENTSGTIQQSIVLPEANGKSSLQLPDGVLITSGEIEKVFNEWKANGENDLVVISNLAERIRQYLAYQEELDPLKEELAKRIYKPYGCRGTDGKEARLIVNNDFVATVKIYKTHSGVYQCMEVYGFKKMLLHLKNPYAIWMKEQKDESDGCTVVDAGAYIAQNGGHSNLREEWEGETVYYFEVTI